MPQTALIDPQRVQEIYTDCCLRGDEQVDLCSIMAKGYYELIYILHPNRLHEHRSEIAAMLACLPERFFRPNHGDNLQNAGLDSNSVVWTENEELAEKLIVLGVGLGLAKFVGGPVQWALLCPGGKPYVVVYQDELM